MKYVTILIFLAETFPLVYCFAMPYKLVALDLDGTTLNSQHSLSGRTIEVLRRLSSKGLQIAIATGRSAASVLDHLEQLQLDQDVCVICYNGAVCFKLPKSTKIPVPVFSRAIDPNSADVLIKLAKRLGLVTHYYNGITGDVYAVPETSEHLRLLKMYEELTGKPQVLVSSYAEAAAKSLAAKMIVLTTDPDELISIAKRELPDGLFHIIRGSPNPFFVEFLSPGVCKGEALVLLCEKLGISLGEVVAFGDGENDAEFLQSAGLGVAMKNARPMLKDVANIVLEVTLVIFLSSYFILFIFPILPILIAAF